MLNETQGLTFGFGLLDLKLIQTYKKLLQKISFLSTIKILDGVITMTCANLIETLRSLRHDHDIKIKHD